MEAGDYVRTKGGKIYKITDLKKYYENSKLIIEKQLVYIDNKCSGYNYEQFSELIIKNSSNIIDLIEVGDYVNGYEVTSKDKFLGFGNHDWYMTNDEIKSIVTKEQFKNIEYEVIK